MKRALLNGEEKGNEEKKDEYFAVLFRIGLRASVSMDYNKASAECIGEILAEILDSSKSKEILNETEK